MFVPVLLVAQIEYNSIDLLSAREIKRVKSVYDKGEGR